MGECMLAGIFGRQVVRISTNGPSLPKTNRNGKVLGNEEARHEAMRISGGWQIEMKTATDEVQRSWRWSDTVGGFPSQVDTLISVYWQECQ